MKPDPFEQTLKEWFVALLMISLLLFVFRDSLREKPEEAAQEEPKKMEVPERKPSDPSKELAHADS